MVGIMISEEPGPQKQILTLALPGMILPSLCRGAGRLLHNCFGARHQESLLAQSQRELPGKKAVHKKVLKKSGIKCPDMRSKDSLKHRRAVTLKLRT